MNILIVSEYFYPRLTGGEIVLWNICKELFKKGHKIQVVTSKFENENYYENIEGMEVYKPFSSFDSVNDNKKSLIKNIVKRISFAIKIYGYLDKFLESEQIDLIYNLAYIPTISSTWVASKHRIPVITGIGSYCGLSHFKVEKLLDALINVSAELFILKIGRHSALRCGNNETAKRLKKFIKVPIYTIASPIDYTIIDEIINNNNISITRKKMEIEPNQKMLIYVGSLLPVKNVKSLINTISALRMNYKLVIVGDGPERENLKKLVVQLKIVDKIIFCGYKSYYETLELMRASDVLILPSKSETFSLVIIEALALGTPVIATRVGVATEFNDPNLHVVNTIQEIDDKLIDKVSNIEENSNVYEYHIDRIVLKFESFFQKMIG